MDAKLTMTLVFLAALGCGHGESPTRTAAAAPKPAPAKTGEPAEVEAPPKETLRSADQLYDSQLGASRAAKFEVDRQVAVLQEAVLLYTQFIERAQGQPEFEPAIRKSRERIEDATLTIEFLLAESRSDGEPPAASTRTTR